MKRKKRVDRPNPYEGTNSEDTARFLRFNLGLANMKPVNLSDATEVYNRVMEYFNLCIEHNMKPTLSALSLSLGMNRYAFSRFANGEKGREVAQVLRGAKSIVEAQLQDYMHNGDVQPLQGMFELNNNYGYKNQIDVVSEQSTEMNEDTKKIAARYAQSLIDYNDEDDEDE